MTIKSLNGAEQSDSKRTCGIWMMLFWGTVKLRCDNISTFIYLWFWFCSRHISVLSFYHTFFKCAGRAIVHWLGSESNSLFPMQSRYWMKCMRFHNICATITFAPNAIISVILVPIRMEYINMNIQAWVLHTCFPLIDQFFDGSDHQHRVSIVMSIHFTHRSSNRMWNKTKMDTFVNNNNNESRLIYYSIGDYGWKNSCAI